MWRHQKRPAICVQRQARLVRLLVERERDQIAQRSFFAVMRPHKSLARCRTKCREGLPVPRRRSDGALELLPKAGDVGSCHAARVFAEVEAGLDSRTLTARP